MSNKLLDDKTYNCDVCSKSFDSYKTYWKHVNRKTACVSSKEIIQQIQSKDSRINYFKTKAKETTDELQKKEKEIEYLKTILQKMDKMDELKDHIVEMKESVDQVKETVEEKDNQFICNQNFNQLNQQNTYYNENKNSIVNIQFSKPMKEKLDHITQDMMMNILDQDSYDKSVGKLIQSIYFHPLAPQNWNWCVTDTDAQLGALEFNHESGNLCRNNPEKVIQKSYSNVMFRVVDMLEELRRSKNMNKPQAINCSRLCNSLGTQLDPHQVTVVKQVAYQGRNLSKSLWDYLDIAVETTTLPNRVAIH